MNRQEVLSAALKTIVNDMEEKEAEGYRIRRKSKSKQSVPEKSTGAISKAKPAEEEDETE